MRGGTSRVGTVAMYFRTLYYMLRTGMLLGGMHGMQQLSCFAGPHMCMHCKKIISFVRYLQTKTKSTMSIPH